MHNKYKIFISPSTDPAFNLSVEEWLMNNSFAKDIIMFLWQNENTIVIGRNQNPYKECDIKKLKEDNVHLVRRLSGGGAVYHDLGNLNFTFISSSDIHDVAFNLEIILKAAAEFGLQGSFTGRNDLTIDGCKFSGNAFFDDNGKSCHHGTLLVDVDFKKLSSYLTASPLKLQSKGIDSVTSRVINLKALAANITIDNLKKALIKSFDEAYGTQAEIINLDENSVDVTSCIEKYRCFEWNFSESPDFAITLEDKFNWGIAEVCFNHSNGIIKECRIFTDAVLQDNFKQLQEKLVSLPFKNDAIINAIDSSIINCDVKRDLIHLIDKKIS